MRNFITAATLALFSNAVFAESIDSNVETKVVEDPRFQDLPFIDSAGNAVCLSVGGISYGGECSQV